MGVINDNFSIGDRTYMLFKKAAKHWAVIHIPADKIRNFNETVMPVLDDNGYIYETDALAKDDARQNAEG